MRRFSIDLTTDLLEEMQFGRELFAHTRPPVGSDWDVKLARGMMDFMKRRIESGLAHVDSIGMPMLQAK